MIAAGLSEVSSMKHTIVYKRAGVYGAFPILQHLPDGRLTVGLSLSPFVDHYAVGPRTATARASSWSTGLPFSFSAPKTGARPGAAESGTSPGSVAPPSPGPPSLRTALSSSRSTAPTWTASHSAWSGAARTGAGRGGCTLLALPATRLPSWRCRRGGCSPCLATAMGEAT